MGKTGTTTAPTDRRAAERSQHFKLTHYPFRFLHWIVFVSPTFRLSPRRGEPCVRPGFTQHPIEPTASPEGIGWCGGNFAVIEEQFCRSRSKQDRHDTRSNDQKSECEHQKDWLPDLLPRRAPKRHRAARKRRPLPTTSTKLRHIVEYYHSAASVGIYRLLLRNAVKMSRAVPVPSDS